MLLVVFWQGLMGPAFGSLEDKTSERYVYMDQLLRLQRGARIKSFLSYLTNNLTALCLCPGCSEKLGRTNFEDDSLFSKQSFEIGECLAW